MASWLGVVLSLVCATTPGANPYSQLDESVDPRLLQKVSYSGSCVKLEDVTEKLTGKTGVNVIAGYTEQDWKVKERKIHVQLKDLPLGTAIREITRCLDYHVTRSGEDGKWTYRIWQDKRAREREEAARRAFRDKMAQAQQAVREQVLADAEQILKMSPDPEKLKDENPYLACLAGTEDGRAGCELLCSLPPEARSAYIRGEKVSVDISQLPSNAQEAARGLAGRMSGMDELYTIALKGLQPVRITIDPSTSDRPLDEYPCGSAGCLTVEGAYDPLDPWTQEVGWLWRDSFAPMAVSELIASNTDQAGTAVIYRSTTATDAEMDQISDRLSRVEEEFALQQVIPGPTPSDPRLLIEVDPAHLMPESGDALARIARELSKHNHRRID